jgi:ABC-type transport system involved in multi-copper enzyme maturation permease subunit
MYWYKAWCETRTVILLGVAAIALACVFIVFNQQAMRDSVGYHMPYVAFIWKAVYDSFGRDLFLILCIVLGSGGLLQEKAHGTSGFTLALPVSRRRILFTRAFVGYLGVLAMALTPAIVLPLGSRFIGQDYSATQALGFSLLWACCGAIFYGYTFLLAHVMEGEYTAMLVAVPSLMAYGFLMAIPWLAHFPMLNIFSIINGEDMPFFNESSHLLTGPMPWLALAIMLLIASLFVFTAARRMEPKDF